MLVKFFAVLPETITIFNTSALVVTGSPYTVALPPELELDWDDDGNGILDSNDVVRWVFAFRSPCAVT